MAKQVNETGSVRTRETGIAFSELEDVVALLHKVYGHDFSGYSRASLKRRVDRYQQQKRLTLPELLQKLANSQSVAEELVIEITVNVTEMFRDPLFYKSFRKNVLPYLNSFPRIRIWNAGCSTGEEVYSFAVLLEEEGLYRKSFLYGTDLNPKVVDLARKGVYSLRQMKEYSENFLHSGARTSLAEYYTAAYEAATIHFNLRKNVHFAVHNLVSDGVFNEFQVVVCRNVLIYFEPPLQDKVLDLLYDSLCPFGFLCLGSKESVRFSAMRERLKVIDATQNIYQKIE